MVIACASVIFLNNLIITIIVTNKGGCTIIYCVLTCKFMPHEDNQASMTQSVITLNNHCLKNLDMLYW